MGNAYLNNINRHIYVVMETSSICNMAVHKSLAFETSCICKMLSLDIAIQLFHCSLVHLYLKGKYCLHVQFY